MFKHAPTRDQATPVHRSSEVIDAPPRSPGFDLNSFLDFDLRRQANGAGVAAQAEAAVSRAAEHTGAALAGDVRGELERGLGADLSAVRVHTGPESAEAAQAVGARAYTTGQSIHFGAGEYDPSSAAGKHLLAHEVVHTVQQGNGSAGQRQPKLKVSGPSDALEVEADRAADALVAGQPVVVAAAGDASIARVPAAPVAGTGAAPGDARLATIDPALWAKCEGALQTFDSAEAAAGILSLRKSGLAYQELQAARGLEVELLDAIDEAEALAAGGDHGAVGAQLDVVAALQDRLQINAELVEAEKELYTLLGTAGVMAGLGPMAAAEATLKSDVPATASAFSSVTTEMDRCLKTINGAMPAIQDIALREELGQLLANVTGPVGELLGKNTIMAVVGQWAVGFVGSKLIDQAVDGKAEWTAPSLTESVKTAHELGTKYLTLIDGMPPIYGALTSWIGGYKKATGLISKLDAASHPAFDALTRLEVLAHRLLDDVAKRMTVTKEQIAAFQQKVVPILDAAKACAGDAANWQAIVTELRATGAPAKHGH